MTQFSKSIIKSLNLTSAQADVYLAALELGQASMQDLSRKSGVKRTTIYKFIGELKERGLILETKRRTRSVYSALPPEQLIAREKSRLSELDAMLPQLKAIENNAHNKPKVRFYEGIEAVKEMYNDSLKDKQPIICWSDLHMTRSVFGAYLESEGYPAERARKNIPLKWIVPESEESREFTRRDYGLLRETKFLPDAKFKMDINVYGDKVSLVNAHAATPFAVLIEDKDIADTLREAWQQLWVRL
jgi:sugar-specific transcriptional regulator TrmB